MKKTRQEIQLERTRDSRNTTVRVLSVPSPKVNGLTMSQASARTRIDFMGVLKAHMQGGAVGLGMRSTVQCCPRMLVSTPWRHGPKTPGARSPHSPKPPKQNPCFYKKIFKGRAVKIREELAKVDELTRQHLAIMQGKGGAALEQSYEDKRNHFMKLYPHRRHTIREMEENQQRRVGR